jgi:hypothetical protein
VFGLVGCLCAVGAASPTEETPNKLEQQVKAAFIVKFAAFIEWPAPPAGSDTNAPFVIGVFGADPFGEEFKAAVRHERVKGRPVELRHSNKSEKLLDCQIVFVSDSEAPRLERVLANFADRPVLVVTDLPGASARGSMINFFKEDGKVRFEFNVAAAEKANLRISAKLLQVGRIAVPGRTGGRNDT